MPQMENAKALRESVDILNVWLDKHKFHWKHRETQLIGWQLEAMAENMEIHNDIYAPEGYDASEVG